MQHIEYNIISGYSIHECEITNPCENPETMKHEKIFTHQTLEEYYRDKRIVITPPPRKVSTQKNFASIHDPSPVQLRAAQANSPLTSGYESLRPSTPQLADTNKDEPIYHSQTGSDMHVPG